MSAARMPDGRFVPISDEQIAEAARVWEECGRSKREAARRLGISRSTLRSRLERAEAAGILGDDVAGDCRRRILRTVAPDGTIEVTSVPRVETSAIRAYFEDDDGVRHFGYTTEEDLRAGADIPDSYETVSFRPNAWPSQDSQGPYIAHQVKAVFRPRPDIEALEELVTRLERRSTLVEPLPRREAPDGKRLLEISIADPHLGLVCGGPASGGEYTIEIACERYRRAVRSLHQMALRGGPIDRVLFVFGNDYLHADGVFHQTTKGTPQPEMDSWHRAFVAGEELVLGEIEWLAQRAPVTVLQIPGNHDRQSSFALGRIINAHFRRNANVEVDASAAPYKFFRWGVNLLGFDHGHIPTASLPSLMAAERPTEWAATRWREWHLGDQHRKAVSRPTFEQHGVSFEFLPSFVTANEWHKLKGYNHQKRAAAGFVWCSELGPMSRHQVNYG